MLKRLHFSSDYYPAAGYSTQRDWYWNALGDNPDRMFDMYTRRTVLARGRQEAENNPWSNGLVGGFPAMIGCPDLRSRTRDISYNVSKEIFWNRWALRCEATGLTLDELVEVVIIEMLVAGEIFVIKNVNGTVSLVQSEHCERIEYYPGGAAKTYFFSAGLDGQPSGGEIPIAAQHVIHVYRQKGAYQGRGRPWMLASLIPARDLYELDQAKTDSIKKSNALIGWTNAPAGKGDSAARGSIFDTTPAADVAPGGAAPANQQTTEQVAEIRPGTIQHMGELTLHLERPEYQTTDHADFIKLKLHAMSTPLGAPVELWYTGMGDVSYSGFKALGAQWAGRRQRYSEWLETTLLNPLAEWRIQKAIDEGDLPASKTTGDQTIRWAWRRAAVLDEERDAKAAAIRIEAGISDLATELERQGRSVDEVFASRRETWIKLQRATGRLKPSQPDTDVIVPEEFMLHGLLPGQQRSLLEATSTEPVEPAQRKPAD